MRINRKIKNLTILTTILLMTFFAFWGCSTKEKNEINIGIVLPLSGPAASHGEDIMAGINLALDGINHSNGIYGSKINLIIEDNQSSAQGSVNALRKLINIHHIPVIIGPVASSNMLAMAPIAEEAKTVLISPAASSPKITEAGDYIFRNGLLAKPQGETMAEFCYKNLNITRAAILFIDDETGRGYKEAFEARFKALGGGILTVESYDKGGSDFRTQLTKIKMTNPAAIYAPSIPKTLGFILRQAKELRISTTFLANYGVEGETLLITAGNSAEGIYYTSISIDDNFVKNFKTRYNRAPTIGAPLGYDTLKLIAQAITDSGYTAEKIKEGLYGIQNFKGVTGQISFDKNGDPKKDVIIKTVKNGSFVIFNPEFIINNSSNKK